MTEKRERIGARNDHAKDLNFEHFPTVVRLLFLWCTRGSFKSGKMRLHNSLKMIKKRCATYTLLDTFSQGGTHGRAYSGIRYRCLLVQPSRS